MRDNMENEERLYIAAAAALEEIKKLAARSALEFLLRDGYLVPAAQILILERGGNTMSLSVTAGGALLAVQIIPLPAGSVLASPADLELTASDPLVEIVPDPNDTTGTIFDVTVPASDTNTSFTLNATGLAPNATPGGAPVPISGSAVVEIVQPAPPPPIPATSLGIVEVTPPTPTSTAQPVSAASTATTEAAPGKQRAAVKPAS
jgi:hypothetical protein